MVAIHRFGIGGGACDSSAMNAGVRMELNWPMNSTYQGVFADNFDPRWSGFSA